MGNALGCSAMGERLATAARDGDAAEARRLVEANPGLARYATFGALNSPLHLAAAKGHNEVATLLLENGADVNSRNISGQTPLMKACQYGHWEVVQTLLLFKSNVSKVEGLGSRTALHYAAAGGHITCIRLLAADFGSSDSFAAIVSHEDGHKEIIKNGALSSFINKPANGGVTALHMASLHRHFDCVHLLLDLHASPTVHTLPYASSSVGAIGAGSTPLHYAACGGNLKCCQILIARGASRSAMNCNGWRPLDVARIWGCHWLEQALSPESRLIIPPFSPSNHLSLPLPSILNIARECGLQLSPAVSDDFDACAICLERACDVAAKGCGHELCTRCALNLCSAIKADELSRTPGAIPCPLCRDGIVSFRKLPNFPAKELDQNLAPNLCSNCLVVSSSNLSTSINKCASEYCKEESVHFPESLPSSSHELCN